MVDKTRALTFQNLCQCSDLCQDAKQLLAHCALSLQRLVRCDARALRLQSLPSPLSLLSPNGHRMLPPAARRGWFNNAGYAVALSTHPEHSETYYCGQARAAGGSERCGPVHGPQCVSCEAFQAVMTACQGAVKCSVCNEQTQPSELALVCAQSSPEAEIFKSQSPKCVY